MAGANDSSVGSSSACGVTTTPGSAPIAAATRSWSDLRSVIRLSGSFGRAGLLGEPLRVQRVVERPQRVDHGPRGRHQCAARRLRVQRVVVQIAGHQHVGAAALVDRGPPRRVGAQRQGLVLAEARVQPRCAPPDFPLALVADHVQLAVVGPGPVLRQMPGVAVGDAAGVLGVLRAEDLRVQPDGLQPRPRLVECGPGVGGPVAELGGGRGVAGRQRGEELLGGRFGSVRFRGARGLRASPRPRRPSADWPRVMLLRAKLPLRLMLRIRDPNFAVGAHEIAPLLQTNVRQRRTCQYVDLDEHSPQANSRHDPAAGARTTRRHRREVSGHLRA